MAYVRDGRCNDFRPSLAALIETSLYHGSVYFNISPNFSLSLTDRNLLDAMKLTIQTNGYNFKPCSEVIAISYRIYYKVLHTLTPNVKRVSIPGTTTLVQTNLLTSNIAMNRLIKWDKINFPLTWTLPQAIDPKPIINKDVDQIVQTSEGDIEVKFNPQRTIILPRSSSSRNSGISNYLSAKDSTIAESRASTSQIREEDLIENIRISNNQIPHEIYVQSRNSPTQSEMSFHLND